MDAAERQRVMAEQDELDAQVWGDSPYYFYTEDMELKFAAVQLHKVLMRAYQQGGGTNEEIGREHLRQALRELGRASERLGLMEEHKDAS